MLGNLAALHQDVLCNPLLRLKGWTGPHACVVETILKLECPHFGGCPIRSMDADQSGAGGPACLASNLFFPNNSRDGQAQGRQPRGQLQLHVVFMICASSARLAPVLRCSFGAGRWPGRPAAPVAHVRTRIGTMASGGVRPLSNLVDTG